MLSLENLITDTRAHNESDFYRKRWGTHTIFSDLPVTSRSDLALCPLSQRSYKKEQGLMKVVYAGELFFLSAWSFADIAQEAYGTSSKRPLVYFKNPYETIEKAMWCYLNGMVPLSGEINADIAMLAARAYQIDSLITDPASVDSLAPYLRERTEPLSSISFIAESFEREQIAHYSQYAKRSRLVLSLPETGAFAEAKFSENAAFTPLPNCSIEKGDTLILTKATSLITPIIRYDTGIPAAALSL
jgi:hypothetical protein